MEFLIELRNQFFKELGKSRLKRILICSLFIAMVWCFADFLSGNLTFNLWHDLICLGLGVVAERMIPWGKQARN